MKKKTLGLDLESVSQISNLNGCYFDVGISGVASLTSGSRKFLNFRCRITPIMGQFFESLFLWRRD